MFMLCYILYVLYYIILYYIILYYITLYFIISYYIYMQFHFEVALFQLETGSSNVLK